MGKYGFHAYRIFKSCVSAVYSYAYKTSIFMLLRLLEEVAIYFYGVSINGVFYWQHSSLELIGEYTAFYGGWYFLRSIYILLMHTLHFGLLAFQ